MALSDHEERVLAEIERQLEQDDPRLAARARRAGGPGGPGGPHRLWWALAGCVAGLVCILVGLQAHLAFGVVGFALMLASVVIGVGELRDRGSAAARRLRGRIDDALEDRRDGPG